MSDDKYLELERRLQLLEDYEAIRQVLAMHPLAVDGGGKESWLAHWTDDSVVSRRRDPEGHSGDYTGTYGKDVMLQELHDPALAQSRKNGLCHCVTPPYISITGDTADATNYLQLLGVEGTGYRIRRVIMSNWELRREDGEWKISKRSMRPLGEEEAVELMTKSLPFGME